MAKNPNPPSEDNEQQTSGGNNNDSGGSNLLQQASNAINKAAKEGVVNKLKDILKRKQEATRAAALCDAEATKLLQDYEAGLL